MKLFGLTITRTKAINTASLSPVDRTNRGWWPIIRESFTGAWQQNVEIRLEDTLSHPTVFACVTLISSDIGKMRLRLVQEDEQDDGSSIWVPVDNPAFSPVLRQPNGYQTRIKFVEQWILSKLIYGNAYVLKERDQRGVVTSLYVLDPCRVRPLVAPNGDVYYELKRDDLSQLPNEQLVVPARELIHDTMYAFYHPLVGLPPLYASQMAARLGLKIQNNSVNFFENGSTPGGVLTAPGAISDATAARLKAYWDENFTGDNVGKVAVLGDGLKYEPMAVSADKSQLTEQWKTTSEAIASAFHVPWHLVGGPPPPYNNIQALTVQYFTQCVQSLAVQLEEALDFGLGLAPDRINGVRYGTEFDIDDLLWMDSATMMTTIREGVMAGVLKPNEGRAKINLEPVDGGDTPYLQQQNFSLRALAKRDAAGPAPLVPTPQSAAPANDSPTGEGKPTTPAAPPAPTKALDQMDIATVERLLPVALELALRDLENVA